MSDPVAPWTHHRPWRNFSPGDLRPRSHQPPWPGQTAIDRGQPDPPYAIFASRPDGWAALALWLLYAHDILGLKTTTEKIAVFAPIGDDNATGSYAAGVAAKVGENADPHDRAVRKALCKAIAHWEDYEAEWPEAEIDSGIMLCDARWPAFLVAARGVSVAPAFASAPATNHVSNEQSADDSAETEALNDAELAKDRA